MTKRTFRRIGFGLLTAAALGGLLQALLVALIGADSPAWDTHPWLIWVVTFAPAYLLSLPLGVLIMKGLPTRGVEPQPLGARRFFVLLLMCFPMMYGGSLIGTALSLLFSGGAAENPLASYAMENSVLKVLVMVVLAPVIEEVLFRKILIDRTARYGEKLAIVFSAGAFALFHMNLFQMFYAFGIGLIFGYVYLRTRRLRYSIVMHMIINFLGTVLAPLLTGLIDTEAIAAAGDVSELLPMLPGLVAYLAYAQLLLGASVAGLVLLIRLAPRAVFPEAEEEIPRGRRFVTVCLNAGVILFVLFCAAAAVLQLFA